ncbi:fumarase, class II [Dethiosulfovibrio salsuginis]|uniref:Fumarate hydratase class II n=1 Tax=Dethiosulfovibrio salsuginis TaxID=561720 RepID=A0A1X7JEF5_9BACT|nr:fumarase, class II [Dethiosulfovibrio salsuginis]
MKYRVERDSLGEVQVPEQALWGAQTQRSLVNFPIGTEKMPSEVIEAVGMIKKAAAIVNVELKVLDKEKGVAIARAADKVIAGDHDDQFPLSLWQTGSGTQTNMNVNEVLANLASKYSGEPIHPNDHVNRSQSSNDVFPTAMHLATVLAVEERLIPAMEGMAGVLGEKRDRYAGLVKIGRTHLQDATPVTLGQEIGGWLRMIERCQSMIMTSVEYLKDLAIGGTAVGTGLNAPDGFGEKVAVQLGDITGIDFRSAPDKFHSLTSKDELVALHGTLKALAADLMKIANDVRWLASGPRCGLGELVIPANEPGSSIMPGKVNPTQVEAITMISVQVMGNDAVVGIAASQGNFQLNVFMPVMINAVLQSVRLLSDGINSFTERCLKGLEADEERLSSTRDRSLMLVTALAPALGYDTAASVAKKAHQERTTLKEAAVSMGVLTGDEFDKLVVPERMV